MSTTLRFREHADFHRSTLLMIAAGLVAALVTHAALSSSASPWALAIVAMAAVAGSLSRNYGSAIHDLAARVGLGAMAAAVLVGGVRAGHTEAAVLIFGLCFGAGMGWGLRGWRLLAAVGLGALVAVLGRSVFQSVVTAEQLSGQPDWLVSAGAGAAFSLVSVFALLPRHLDIRFQRDPVAAAYSRLRGSLGGEIEELVERGHALWQKCEGELAEGSVDRETLREGVIRLFDVAERWRAVDSASTDELADSLGERIAGLEQRMANTEDAVTKNQYQQAKDALQEQLRYIKDIRVNRERVLARMHNYLAAMERLRLAVINVRTSNASRDAVDVQPLIADLQSIGADMDSCSTAMLEADRAMAGGSLSV